MKDFFDGIWFVLHTVCLVVGFIVLGVVVVVLVTSPFVTIPDNKVESLNNYGDFRDKYISNDMRRAPILPEGAKNVQDKGNGWMTFELGEKTFLYARHSSGNGACSVSITQVK